MAGPAPGQAPPPWAPDYVLIDEAGQATVPEALIPITLAPLPCPSAVVLCGEDHGCARAPGPADL
eukprot:365825-Chlamydomonas_euryale.AAC.9